MNPARGPAVGRHLLLAVCLMTGVAAGQGTSPRPARDPQGPRIISPPQPSQTSNVPATSSEPPIPILLNGPADLDELLKRLNRPDFLVVPGSELKTLPTPPAPATSPVISSWSVRGEVFGDLAHLTIDLECRLDDAGPIWVPVKLDGLTVNEVREGSQALPSRTEGTGTAIELRGQGPHRVQIEARVPVLTTSEGRSIALSIPPAASTSIQLRVPGVVESCSSGTGEPVACLPVEAGHLTELTTRLSPRARLQLQWRVKSDAGANLPPLLSCRGEIAVEIDLGTLKARSSWNLSAIRGQVDRLSLGLTPGDELVDVELDGRPVAVVSNESTTSGQVAIPLIDPLRTGQVRTLTLTTRRAIDLKSSRELVYNGIRFQHAVDQSGAIAVSQDPTVWIQPVSLRGLRRIDPRTDLPQDLRSRPSISMAFGFNDLPFDLRLAIEASPARLRVASNTTAEIDPSRIQVTSVLDFESSRGLPFEVRIVLPVGLEFLQAGPAGLVESSQLNKRASGPLAGSELTLRLNRAGQEQGRFRIVLQGVAKLGAAGPARIPIFVPQAETTVGGQLAVVTPPGTYVEPAPGSSTGAFRRMLNPPRAWEWPPSLKADPGVGVAWFRHDSGAAELPITLTVLPTLLRHETLTTTNLEPAEREWVSDIRLQIDGGSIRTLEIELPAGPGEWSITGANVARRESMKSSSEGRGRYRLWFSRELSGNVTLRLRGSGGGETSAEPGWEILPDVRVLDGEERSRKVRFHAASRREVEVQARGWQSVRETPAVEVAPRVAQDAPSGLLTQTYEALPGSDAPLLYRTRTAEVAELPRLVVPRCWLRSSRTPDGGWIHSAWFQCEGPARAIDLELPGGAALVGIRKEPGEGAGEPERLDRPNTFRFPISGEASEGPSLVGVTYETEATTDPTIEPPQILGGAVVLQAIWDVWIGDHRTGVSVPDGWNDDNRWTWGVTHFLRTPMRSPTDLARWIAPANLTSRIPDLLDLGLAEGQHGYQFSRSGGLGPLRFRIVNRASVVSLCSGVTLGVGLLFIFLRLPSLAAWSLAILSVFVLGCVLEPSLSLLIVQSSSFGLLLSLGAAWLRWFIEGRSRPVFASGEISAASSIGRPQPSGSGRAGGPSETGSIGDAEGSTAIRPRPLPSTADRLLLSPTQPAQVEGASSPGREQGEAE